MLDYAMVNLSPVVPAQYRELAEFLVREGRDGETPETWLDRFRFWWDMNPAAREDTRGWVLTDEAAIVGFLGAIPMEFQLLGERTVAYNATTWRVANDYRAHSMKLFFQAISASKNSILFNTTPNRNVVPILEGLKFRKLPSVHAGSPWRPSSVIVIDFQRVLRKKVGGVFFAELAATAAAIPLSWTQQMRLRGLREGRFEVREVGKVGASFDDLWERTRGKYSNTAVRTAESLDWYCHKGSKRKKLIAAFTRGCAVGFLILWPRTVGGLRMYECVDIWVDSADDGVVAALVTSVRDCAAREEADLVLFPHFTADLGNVFRRLGLFRRNIRHRPEYFKTAPDNIDKIDKTNSYLVDTQGDTTFFP